MTSLRGRFINARILAAIVVLALAGARVRAQGALFLEEPYGWFGILNPTGHVAVYLERVCAESTVKLRRCHAGELGAVIDRHLGNGGHDWIATPLLPYLYAVDDPAQVPARVDSKRVAQLRAKYEDSRKPPPGSLRSGWNAIRGTWSEQKGASYIRRVFVFRFETTEAQDDALIARLNTGDNRLHFDLLVHNCADLVRDVLSLYFPGSFGRQLFPDLGISSPKEVAKQLVRYARKHPELKLTVFEIPQIPGYCRHRRPNRGVAEAFLMTGYIAPLAYINPFVAGAMFVDYLAAGRDRPVPIHPQVLTPDTLSAFLTPASPPQTPVSAVPRVTDGAIAAAVQANGPAISALVRTP
jgi:hypothetical protein